MFAHHDSQHPLHLNCTDLGQARRRRPPAGFHRDTLPPNECSEMPDEIMDQVLTLLTRRQHPVAWRRIDQSHL